MSRSVLSRIAKAVAWSIAAFVLLFVAAAIALLFIDVNVWRGKIEARASSALDRQVTFAGDMEFVPSLLPRLAVHEVRIANPDWASRPYFATIRRLEVQVDLLSLFSDRLSVQDLELEGVDVLMERGPDGATNWQFATTYEVLALPDFHAISAGDSALGYRVEDGGVELIVFSTVQGKLVKGQDVELEWSASYGDLLISGGLRGGTFAEFLEPTKPWPIAGDLKAAATSVTFSGYLYAPPDAQGTNLQVAVRGTRIDALLRAFGADIPDLGPYELSAHVAATAGALNLEDLDLRVGSSDLSGQARWSTGEPGSRLTGTFSSQSVNLDELLAAFDRDRGNAVSARSENQPATTNWIALDTDLRLEVQELVFSPAPFHDLSIHATITGATAPSSDGIESTRRDGSIRIEAGGKWRDLPVAMTMHGGSLAKILSPTKPWPIHGTVNAGETSLSVDGTIVKPMAVEDVELTMALEGSQLGDLAGLLEMDFPALGPFRVTGRLLDADDGYRLEGLTGRLAESDFSGRLELLTSGRRPAVSGRLSSKRVDLGALLTGTSQSPETSDKKPSPPDTVLPTPDLSRLDLDLQIEIRELLHPDLPVKDATLHAKLTDGRLLLDPLRGGIPGANVSGRLTYRVQNQQPVVSVEARAQQLAVKKLLDLWAERPPPVSANLSDVTVRLDGRGQTVRELVSAGDLAVSVGRSSIEYARAAGKQPVRVTLSSAQASSQHGGDLKADVRGVFRQTPFKLKTASGPPVELLWAQQPWTFKANGKVGAAAVSADAMVKRVGEAADWKLAVKMSGAQLKELSGLVGTKLPKFGPYVLEGKLTETAGYFNIDELSARIGDTRATGKLHYVKLRPRPRFKAEVKVEQLQLADFVKKPEPDGEKMENREPRQRVIPDFEIPMEQLSALDGMLRLEVNRILAGEQELGTARLRVRLKDGHLLASPVSAGDESATYLASLELQPSRGAAAVAHWAKFREENAGRILVGLGIAEKLLGKMDIEVSLSGRGQTFLELLTQGRGRIIFIGGKGTVPRRLLEIWGGSVIRAVFAEVDEKEQAELNCVVARFYLEDGMLQSDAILIDTTDITIGGHGALDLRTEEITGILQPAPKSARVLRLGTPVVVSGTLANPAARPRGSSAVLRLGKLALGFLNPAYLVLLTDVGTGEENPCLAAVERRDAGGEIPERRGLFGLFGRSSTAPPQPYE